MDKHTQEYFDFIKKLETDPDFCLDYIRNNPRHEQCLITISKSAKHSFRYAIKFRTRFSLGEEAISKDASASLGYARDVTKERFILGEEAISKDANCTLGYAKEVIRGRFELGEEAISKIAAFAFEYANDIIKGRFELGELAISSSKELSLKYALEVIKGKLPEDMHNKMIATAVAA